jgi:hypothetical protein
LPQPHAALPGCVLIAAALGVSLSTVILYIERNPKLVRSITGFPYIVNSL